MMETTKPQKKYNCQHCIKVCNSKSHLNYHLKTHSTARFNCSQCGKSLKNSTVLRKHEKSHSDAPSPCSVCGKLFRSNFTLSAHMAAQHHQEFRFQCDLCEKKYAKKSTLQQHRLKHYAKQFECGQCQKKFQRNSTLKLHQRRHSQTERFKCSTCPRSFSDASTLQRHSKTHKYQHTKYKCKLCNTITVRRDNMLRHVRNMHLGEDFNNCVQEQSALAPTLNEPTSIELPATRNTEHPTVSDGALSMNQCSNMPKTVANSSVIKCVGNVEPIKVVTQDEHVETTPPSSGHRVEADDVVTAKPIVHLKEYNPIELYRKILSAEAEDEDSNEKCTDTAETDASDTDTYKLRDYETAMPPGGRMTTATTALNATTSDFSATHWRKNFKYTYQYQEY